MKTLNTEQKPRPSLLHFLNVPILSHTNNKSQLLHFFFCFSKFEEEDEDGVSEV